MLGDVNVTLSIDDQNYETGTTPDRADGHERESARSGIPPAVGRAHPSRGGCRGVRAALAGSQGHSRDWKFNREQLHERKWAGLRFSIQSCWSMPTMPRRRRSQRRPSPFFEITFAAEPQSFRSSA